jgi:hypothetical protein
MRGRPLIVSDQCYTKLKAVYLTLPDSGAPDTIVPESINGNFFQQGLVTDQSENPIGLQRYGSLYTQYTVLGTRLSVEPIWNDPSLAIPIQWGFYPRNEGDGVLDSVNTVGEFPYSRWTVYRGPTQSNGQRMSSFMSTNKIMGQKTPYARIEDEVSGEFSGSAILEPARTWYWDLFVGNLNGNALTEAQRTALNWSIKITYYVRFFGRRSNPFA